MKFNILNNEPIQFFNAEGVLVGTIQISGSGDMLIRPESGSSRDIILGDQTTMMLNTLTDPSIPSLRGR